MDRVSSHAATAFSAAAAPFAEMGKSLVKAIDESRAHSASTAKDSQDLLVQALKNRIIEGGQSQKTSIADDIKGSAWTLAIDQGLLGDAGDKTQP